MNVKLNARKIDYVLLAAIIILSLFGLLMVYSASNVVAKTRYNDSFYFLKRQLMFFIVGLILMFVIIKSSLKKLEKMISTIFLISFISLFVVLIPGIGIVRGGARSWIGFGGFSVQPSEFMKLSLTSLYAKYLADNYKDLKKLKNFIMVFFLAIVVFLVIMLQPDFGTGLVIVASAFFMILISGVPIKYFLVIIILGGLGITALIISAPYRVERILAFINPWEDPLGSGFQGIQSLFAITPGGLFGHGFNNSMQKHFFLPEPQNDFIFAIVVEEFGLIGGAIVLFFYFIIIYRGIRISLSVENNFFKFLSLGIVINLFVQVFINIGVVIGLLPVTGITLPLFSYGGSSLVLTMISLALLVSISKYRNYDYR